MKKEEPLDDLSEFTPKKKSGKRLFAFAQVAAFAGTVVDFLLVIFLTEVVGIWYVASNALGATGGAITNFVLGRYWVFSAAQKKMFTQAFRYFLVAAGSMMLNTLGVYLLTEFTVLHYLASKIIVAIFIAFTFNFFLQKNFVFK